MLQNDDMYYFLIFFTLNIIKTIVIEKITIIVNINKGILSRVYCENNEIR